MPRSTRTTLRLLGPFAVEANGGRPVSVRSRKAQALLAYLAMKPDGRARREEIATLLWGDNPDSLARHSLRQCLLSLRQDLHHLAPGLLFADRDVIGLRVRDLVVDAREFAALAANGSNELARAAELWRGEFLVDLVLDIEAFESWLRHERDRLATIAARTFEKLCKDADAARDGDRAIAAAERLVALDPTLEDRQRIALQLYARYRGREAALDQARSLTNLLRSELDLAPDPATRALIDAIRRGDIKLEPRKEPAPAPRASDANDAPDHTPAPSVAAPSRFPVAIPRIRPAGLAMVTALALGALAVLDLATGSQFLSRLNDWRDGVVAFGPDNEAFKAKASARLAGIVVLPFTVDSPRDATDLTFAGC